MSEIIECAVMTNCSADSGISRFDGTPVEAQAAGWEETEFGWACPDCREGDPLAVQLEDDESAGATTLSATSEDLGALMVAAAAHASVDRKDLARQAFDRLVAPSSNEHYSYRLDVAAAKAFIGTLGEGHQPKVTRELVSYVTAMQKAVLNDGAKVSDTIENYEEALTALRQ